MIVLTGMDDQFFSASAFGKMLCKLDQCPADAAPAVALFHK